MIHAYNPHGRPICGAPVGVGKVVPVTQVYYRDLCPGCMYENYKTSQRIKRRRK